MARVIVLDSGPLGDACRARSDAFAKGINRWLIQMRTFGAIVVIPEIADYEVRRELLRIGASNGLDLLDNLRSELYYAPTSTAVMREAALLWAEARSRGTATANDHALDGDVIVAAQARMFVGLRDVLTLATSNPDHLSRYVPDARPWEGITS